jgi:AraC-like DNA-binding protein
MSAQYGNVEYSRNSYDFIGSAIQSVINAKNEADQRLALARSAGNNTLIFNALKYGSYTSRERDALKTLMGEIVQAYVVMVVRADGGREEHMNQMEALLRDRYRGRLVAAREDESEDILIAAVETEDAAEALYEAATTLYDAFLPHDVRLQIGLSERAWGIERLHGAYIEARYALTATENEPMNPVLRYGADVEMPRQESLTPSMLVKLNDIMFSGNGAGVVEFFDEALHALPIIGARFQTVYCAINMTVQSAANALGQKEDASSEYMADEDPEAALQRLQSRALAVCEMVVARRQNGSLRMRKSAIDYILENYADPNLCADEIADSLHISRNGVYRLLKETTGHTLAEYVEGVRIRKVEELLLSTDKGVEEIAELTGFGAVNTLYRVFKKRHGIPPGVWRKENDPNRTI